MLVVFAAYCSLEKSYCGQLNDRVEKLIYEFQSEETDHVPIRCPLIELRKKF